MSESSGGFVVDGPVRSQAQARQGRNSGAQSGQVSKAGDVPLADVSSPVGVTLGVFFWTSGSVKPSSRF